MKAQARKGFCVLSGEDGIAGAFLAQGADGCISVSSNVAPALCAQFQNAWAQKDYATFEQVQTKLAPLHKALFCESSPAPVKYAASRLGLCSDEVRLPLLPASAGARATLDPVLDALGLIAEDGSAKLRHHG
jgi:4-hydroxy-tetrahydrodipicolinate synthase